MIHTIIESNVLLYVMAAMGALSILGQLLVNGCYKKLMREVANTQAEKGEFLKRIRYKYQIDRKRSGEQVNIPIFVKQIMMNYRFHKWNFHQWKRGIVSLFMASLVMGLAGIWTAWNEVDLQTAMMLLMRGIAVLSGMMAIVVLWTDLGYKEMRLQMGLEDYLCHSGIGTHYEEIHLEQEESKEKRVPSIIGVRKKAEKHTESKAQMDKRELQENLARMKEAVREIASDEEVGWKKDRNKEILKQMDAQEQERIIRDVLAEFLA